MPLSTLTGTLLRERRLALALRQSDLAAQAGISASYLNLIEHNRRNVTADVLARLAQALGIDPAALADGAGGVMVEDLRAGAALAGGEAELDRLEDFAGRFPGWAGVVAALYRRSEGLERAVEALNDRMTHDPHLSASLHDLLSALSSVRSTAAILAETEQIDPDWRARFHRNLHQDSERLAAGAEVLVAYLDGSDQTREQGLAAPQEELEAWLAARGWHLPEAETPDTIALDPQIAGLASGAARAMARAWVSRAQADAQALPLPAFRAALAEHGPDPARLAALFGADLIAVARRIATLPASSAGLVTCDASGTLLIRKPTDGFAMPRFGAACPLWPLYAALSRPLTPIEAVVETAGRAGRRLLVRAISTTRHPQGFGGPSLQEAAMLILPDAASDGPALPLGSTCRICPRPTCAARREPSILSADA
ncbi:MAG: short-chain fatty acyl-CoA regulator family protein [Pseudomonadota bacterium]